MSLFIVTSCNDCPFYSQDSQYDNDCAAQIGTGNEQYDHDWFPTCPLKVEQCIVELSNG